MGESNQVLENSVVKTDRNFMQNYVTVLAFVAKVSLDPVSKAELLQLLGNLPKELK